MFRVGRRRSAACVEWDGPTSALSHHHQRVITGAETAAPADGGIARCLPETFGQTVPRSPRWLLGLGTFVMPGGREWGDGSRLVG